MKKNLKKVQYTFAVIVLLNVLYALFFYTKSYEGAVKISLDIQVSSPTQIWYVYKTKNSEERQFSARQLISPYRLFSFDYELDDLNEIEYIGLFWNAPLESSITLLSYSFEVGGNSFSTDSPIKIIDYTNPGSITSSLDNGVKISSRTSKRNWVILNDTEKLNKQRDKKIFKPLPLVVNLALTLVLILYFFGNQQVKIERFSNSNTKIRNVRLMVFALWLILMPFWIIISHTLMALSLVLMLYEYYITPKNKIKMVCSQYFLFFVFYLGIVISNFFSSSLSTLANLALDYSYFLIMPFCFLGVSSGDKEILLKYLKKGISIYILLLLIFTTQNYILTKPDYSFFKFLTICLEQFWHTSYFSALLLILFIANAYHPIKGKYFEIIYYLFCLVFMYTVSARLPFLIGLVLLMFRVIYSMKRKKPKLILISSTVLMSIILLLSFLTTSKNSNTGNINSLDARFSIWQSATIQIGENYIFGVGNKNTTSAISSKIKEKYKTKYRDYNAHNQFIETILGNGVFVGIILILLFYGYFNFSGDYGKLFIISCLLLFMVESYFQRQAGVVFFTFWATFFGNYVKLNND